MANPLKETTGREMERTGKMLEREQRNWQEDNLRKKEQTSRRGLENCEKQVPAA